MDESTLVSILIPVFNRQDFIGQCIESALMQTYRNLEVVVVDNASTDDTWQICEHYRRSDNRLRTFKNPENIGPVLNWKRCIEEARGKYSKILFSDDLIHGEYLTRTVPLMDEPGVGFVLTPTVIGAEPWNGSKVYGISQSMECFRSWDFILWSLFGTRSPVSPGCALFRTIDIRRNLLFDLPGFEKSDFRTHGAGSDLLILLLTALQYELVGFIPEPLVFFRSHPGSITSRGRENSIQEAYLLSRLWFANLFLDRRTAKRFNTYTWLRKCTKERRLIPHREIDYPTFTREYPTALDILKWSVEKPFFKRKIRSSSKVPYQSAS
ncbi:MAG: glycosyltransferase family 2 protein [bacterium]|nr:glycosyltransferase family 2 protein [bacterium]